MAALTEEQRRKLKALNLLITGDLSDANSEKEWEEAFDKLETTFVDMEKRLDLTNFLGSAENMYKMQFDANALIGSPRTPGQAPLKTKDFLKDIINGRQNFDEYSTVIETALSTANYPDIIIDGNLTDEEQGFLPDFVTRLDSDQTLSQIFADNEAKQVEAARLAAEEAERLRKEEENRLAQESLAEANRLNQEQLIKDTQGQVLSQMVYSGYLNEDDINNQDKVALAFQEIIAVHSPHENRRMVEDRVFSETAWFPVHEDWSIKNPSYALSYLQDVLPDGMMPQNESRTGPLLQEHLESGKPESIELAQGYLLANHPNAENLHVTGKIDEATYNTAIEDLQAPLEIPPGLFDANGNVRMDNMLEMAAHGQLYLPISALSEDDQKIARELPLAANRGPGDPFSQERFAAMKLIAEKGPEGYQEILDAENARRAGTRLNVNYAAAQENVAAIVSESEQALETAVAPDMKALPPNLAAIIVTHGETNGFVSLNDLPGLISKARNDGMITDSTMSASAAYTAAHHAGIDETALSTPIALDPASENFSETLQGVLQAAYAMDNSHVKGTPTGVTVNNIPQNVLDGIKTAADGQIKVQDTLVAARIEDLGLPSDFLSRISAAPNGRIVPSIIHTFMEPKDTLYSKYSDYATMNGTAYEDLSGPGIDEIKANNGMVDVKDPNQLAVVIQMAHAIETGKTLEEVRADQNILDTSVATAQGYVGANANKPAETPEAPSSEEPEDLISSVNDGKMKIATAFHGAGADGFDDLPVVENATSMVPDDNALPLKTKVANFAVHQNNIG